MGTWVEYSPLHVSMYRTLASRTGEPFKSSNFLQNEAKTLYKDQDQSHQTRLNCSGSEFMEKNYLSFEKTLEKLL